MSTIIQNFATLLLASAEWATWTDSVAPQLHIQEFGFDEDDQKTRRPLAVIAPLEEFDRTIPGLGQSKPSGAIKVHFLDEIAAENVNSNGTIDIAAKRTAVSAFANHIDQVLIDIQLLGQTAGYLAVARSAYEGLIELPPPDDAQKRKQKGYPVDLLQIVRVEFGLDDSSGG